MPTVAVPTPSLLNEEAEEEQMRNGRGTKSPTAANGSADVGGSDAYDGAHGAHSRQGGGAEEEETPMPRRGMAGNNSAAAAAAPAPAPTWLRHHQQHQQQQMQLRQQTLSLGTSPGTDDDGGENFVTPDQTYFAACSVGSLSQGSGGSARGGTGAARGPPPQSLGSGSLSAAAVSYPTGRTPPRPATGGGGGASFLRPRRPPRLLAQVGGSSSVAGVGSATAQNVAGEGPSSSGIPGAPGPVASPPSSFTVSERGRKRRIYSSNGPLSGSHTAGGLGLGSRGSGAIPAMNLSAALGSGPGREGLGLFAPGPKVAQPPARSMLLQQQQQQHQPGAADLAAAHHGSCNDNDGNSSWSPPLVDLGSLSLRSPVPPAYISVVGTQGPGNPTSSAGSSSHGSSGGGMATATTSASALDTSFNSASSSMASVACGGASASVQSPMLTVTPSGPTHRIQTSSSSAFGSCFSPFRSRTPSPARGIVNVPGMGGVGGGGLVQGLAAVGQQQHQQEHQQEQHQHSQVPQVRGVPSSADLCITSQSPAPTAVSIGGSGSGGGTAAVGGGANDRGTTTTKSASPSPRHVPLIILSGGTPIRGGRCDSTLEGGGTSGGGGSSEPSSSNSNRSITPGKSPMVLSLNAEARKQPGGSDGAVNTHDEDDDVDDDGEFEAAPDRTASKRTVPSKRHSRPPDHPLADISESGGARGGHSLWQRASAHSSPGFGRFGLSPRAPLPTSMLSPRRVVVGSAPGSVGSGPMLSPRLRGPAMLTPRSSTGAGSKTIRSDDPAGFLLGPPEDQDRRERRDAADFLFDEPSKDQDHNNKKTKSCAPAGPRLAPRFSPNSDDGRGRDNSIGSGSQEDIRATNRGASDVATANATADHEGMGAVMDGLLLGFARTKQQPSPGRPPAPAPGPSAKPSPSSAVTRWSGGGGQMFESANSLEFSMNSSATSLNKMGDRMVHNGVAAPVNGVGDRGPPPPIKSFSIKARGSVRKQPQHQQPSPVPRSRFAQPSLPSDEHPTPIRNGSSHEEDQDQELQLPHGFKAKSVLTPSQSGGSLKRLMAAEAMRRTLRSKSIDDADDDGSLSDSCAGSAAADDSFFLESPQAVAGQRLHKAEGVDNDEAVCGAMGDSSGSEGRERRRRRKSGPKTAGPPIPVELDAGGASSAQSSRSSVAAQNALAEAQGETSTSAQHPRMLLRHASSSSSTVESLCKGNAGGNSGKNKSVFFSPPHDDDCHNGQQQHQRASMAATRGSFTSSSSLFGMDIVHENSMAPSVNDTSEGKKVSGDGGSSQGVTAHPSHARHYFSAITTKSRSESGSTLSAGGESCSNLDRYYESTGSLTGQFNIHINNKHESKHSLTGGQGHGSGDCNYNQHIHGTSLSRSDHSHSSLGLPLDGPSTYGSLGLSLDGPSTHSTQDDDCNNGDTVNGRPSSRSLVFTPPARDLITPPAQTFSMGGKGGGWLSRLTPPPLTKASYGVPSRHDNEDKNDDGGGGDGTADGQGDRKIRGKKIYVAPADERSVKLAIAKMAAEEQDGSVHRKTRTG